RRRHTRSDRDWSSDVCSSDLRLPAHLLAGRAAHRTADGERDAEVETEPLEDALVGDPVQVVGVLEPGVVEVEGVRVLHDELAPRSEERRVGKGSRWGEGRCER